MRKLFTKILISLAIVIPLTMLAAFASDFQAPSIPDIPTIPQPPSDGGRSFLIDRVLPNVAVILIGIIVGGGLIFGTIGGIRFLTAYGNTEKHDKARDQVIWAIAAIILALLAYTIVTIVANLEFVNDNSQQTEPTSSFFLTAHASSAKDLVPPPNNNTPNDELDAVENLPDVELLDLVASLVKTLLGSAMILTLIALIVASVYYMLSRGEEESIKKAKDIILYLIIGIIIMAAIYGIVTGITEFEFFQ